MVRIVVGSTEYGPAESTEPQGTSNVNNLCISPANCLVTEGRQRPWSMNDAVRKKPLFVTEALSFIVVFRWNDTAFLRIRMNKRAWSQFSWRRVGSWWLTDSVEAAGRSMVFHFRKKRASGERFGSVIFQNLLDLFHEFQIACLLKAMRARASRIPTASYDPSGTYPTRHGHLFA